MRILRAFILNTLLITILLMPLLSTIVTSDISPSDCEKVAEYRIYSSDFGTGDPYGDANVLVTVCKLIESVPDYDWYFYYIRFQTIPRHWETAHEYLYHSVWNPGSVRWLWDYSPTYSSAYNGGTTTVTISLSIPIISWSYSESYVISWLKILDKSNFETHQANWEADFNEQEDPPDGPSTQMVLLEYGFTVETLSGYCSFVDGKYGIMWGQSILGWWRWETFWTPTMYLDLCP